MKVVHHILQRIRSILPLHVFFHCRFCLDFIHHDLLFYHFLFSNIILVRIAAHFYHLCFLFVLFLWLLSLRFLCLFERILFTLFIMLACLLLNERLLNFTFFFLGIGKISLANLSFFFLRIGITVKRACKCFCVKLTFSLGCLASIDQRLFKHLFQKLFFVFNWVIHNRAFSFVSSLFTLFAGNNFRSLFFITKKGRFGRLICRNLIFLHFLVFIHIFLRTLCFFISLCGLLSFICDLLAFFVFHVFIPNHS